MEGEGEERREGRNSEWGMVNSEMVMVEVVNSTPEPDGECKTYWLRVPPATQRARQGVAWTFDMPEAEYVLEAQT